MVVENISLINSCCASGWTNQSPITRTRIPRALDYTLIKQSIFIKLIIGRDRASEPGELIRLRVCILRSNVFRLNGRHIVHNDAINMDAARNEDDKLPNAPPLSAPGVLRILSFYLSIEFSLLLHLSSLLWMYDVWWNFLNNHSYTVDVEIYIIFISWEKEGRERKIQILYYTIVWNILNMFNICIKYN